ncbi:PREDICTED: pentatricopeptide repeat-containing protein At5g18950-like isoform X2 [Camelina sativa]|uniref:Pentatricopeptide repeat-containing protein At5g18950-like isoform X1 n=1 Tax=Camelina sativa TaxID=90675 RepID=A0ABM0VCH9_CAMSA|nr:PREDICTED: pentatricopeptide repeat-containing protein At5g18950-like isoform X1 [Camelina sativa]XP_010454153.1 PREDICTED: pentatricopeptide repeat-containing protein At5g18950-like isoform X2 [Camelina sativa]
MSRGQSYLISLFRNRTRQSPNTQLRSLTLEPRDSESNPNEQKCAGGGTYTEMAKTVSTIMRERQRWQQTLVSDFPSFNFADPLFFRELLKSQNNVLFSLWFFRWLCSNYDYTPDPVSLNLLFGALLDAKAVKAAKSFLDTTGFNPEPTLLELYVKFLSEDGLVEEAVDVYNVLKETGISPTVVTCNAVLLGCLKARKLNLFWELHKGMMESEVDLERIRCLVLIRCRD